ncbi:MAG: N-acetylmuramoyl-L-alanine amidase [Novosphingobium sp.]
MRRASQILLLGFVPLAVLGGLVWVDRTFGLIGRGRDYVIRLELPPPSGEVGLPKVEGPLDSSRPLVVIDAGHGGFDPGAGLAAVQEKDVTLELAKALRDKLIADGGVRVALTRDDDRFLVLEERAGIARRLKADLFISIHADAAPTPDARGGTVYVLSEKGSNQTAALLAEKENRANVINGVRLSDKSDEVSSILVDLAQRETTAQSEDFAALILREGRGSLHFKDSAIQSAAFIVLKSPDLPSVLFEAGYITSPEDAAWLWSREGRSAFAASVGSAIRVYFARHQPG